MSPSGWGSWSDALSMVGTWATFIVAAIAVWLAKAGSDAWREQLLGKSKHDAARALLRSIYVLKLCIEDARFPWSFGGDKEQQPDADTPPEGETRAKRLETEESERRRMLAIAEDARKRMPPVTKARAELILELQDARAVLGQVAVDAVDPVLVIASEPASAIRNYEVLASLSYERHPFAAEIDDQFRIFIDIGTTKHPDEYGPRLEEAVAQAEAALKLYIG